MPTSSWQTPTLLTVRQQNRDYVTGKLGYQLVANSPEAVLSDAAGGNAHENLQYLDWQANQLLPDTCEKQFLDRWANIFLINADGSRGRKLASFASGTVTVTASTAVPLPSEAILTCGNVLYQTTAAVPLGVGQNAVPAVALDAGAVGNQIVGTVMALQVAVQGVSGQTPITVVSMTGGADEESDDELRARVLARIRQPPMGGDASDYVAWALGFPGVTRAWCSPKEMGPGTVTVRFMMDDLRASTNPLTNGFPLPADVAMLQAYMETVRPVCADVFVVAPLPQPINFVLQNLPNDSPQAPNTALRAAVAVGAAAMLLAKGAPASQFNGVAVPPVNIPSAWVNDAVYQAVGGIAYDLVMADAVMANNGCLAVLGTIG